MPTAEAVETSHIAPGGRVPLGAHGLCDQGPGDVAAGTGAIAEVSPCIGAAASDLAAEELRAWRGLLRAHASLAKLVGAELERQHRLPMTSYEVLKRLEEADQGRMRMCDLADQAQMSRSGLTRLVDRLERDGLIERCSCEHDARGAYACLTDAGRSKLSAARSTHLAVVREHFLSRFSPEELGALAEMWERVAPCCGSC